MLRPSSGRLFACLTSLLVASASLPIMAGAALAQQTIAVPSENELPTVEVTPPRIGRGQPGAVASDATGRQGATPGPGQGTARSLAESPSVAVSPTATATPTGQVASSVTVITADDIAREQRRTVPDLLQQVPGLNVVQTGGPGGQTSVFIRGTNANHVKVFIDGIDVSDPSNANRSFDFGQLLTGDIARVEVLRGPQSGFYGADAIGGVISIVTKKGEGPPKASLTVEGGSFGTFNQTGTLRGAVENFNYAFAIQHFRSETTPVTPRELVPAGRRINPNWYDNATYSTKLGADVTDWLSLNYVARFTDSKLLYTGDSGFPSAPDAYRSSQDAQQFFTRGEAVVSLFENRLKNYFGYAYTNEYSANQGPPTLFGAATPSQNFGYRTKYDYRGDIALAPGQTLILGAQREDEKLNTKALRAENGNTGVFAELQSEIARRIFLTSNIRYDDNDAFGSALTYRVAPAVIIPGTETKLKASVGTGFKAPTLSQLYVDYRPAFTFFGNPNLKPEESFGFDAGFEQPLPGDKVRFGAVYYQNDIHNLIATDASFTSYTNIGRAKTFGVEAFLSVAFSDQLSARVDYTNTTTKDEIARQELLRRPRHKVSTTINYMPLDKLTLSATTIFLSSFVDGNRDFSVSRLRAPGYAIVNLAANYAVDEHWSVFGRVDNLFDRRYEDPTGFLRPGLAAYAGLRVTN